MYQPWIELFFVIRKFHFYDNLKLQIKEAGKKLIFTTKIHFLLLVSINLILAKTVLNKKLLHWIDRLPNQNRHFEI